MKVANLVVAIIYTCIYTLMIMTGMYNDGELVVGAIILSGPVVINWMSWNYLKKIEKNNLLNITL